MTLFKMYDLNFFTPIKSKFFFSFVDLSIDISKIGTDQANELNSTAHGFGMTTNDFYSFLNNDLEEAENIQLARLAEEEKAMFAVSFSN